MAIQNRRGNYSDFDPSKMVEGEIAVVKNGDPNTSDGTAIYVSTATGSAKRIALHQDIIQEVYDAIEEAIPNYIDNSLTETGKAADAKKTGDEIADLKDAIEQIEADKADTDGTYPDMTVGMAEQLDSDVHTEDSEPYHFRKSGGGNVRVGDREVDRIVGGTVAWNQLANGSWLITGGSKTENPDGSCVFVASAAGQQVYNGNINGYSGHKYLASVSFKTNSATTDVAMRVFSVNYAGVATTNWQTRHTIAQCYVTGGASVGVVDNRASGWDDITVNNYMLIDLTVLFADPTIADYIYSLEQSTAGAGVAWVRRYIDIDTYHPYDAGTLKSVEGLVSHDMVGKNLINMKDLLPNGEYSADGKTFTAPSIGNRPVIQFFEMNTNIVFSTASMTFGGTGFRIEFYDNSDTLMYNAYLNTDTTTFSINNVCRARVNYGNNGTLTITEPMIRFSSVNDSTYEPYEKHSYPLDSSVKLNGVFNLVDGKLVADGDEYSADGTVSRTVAEATIDISSIYVRNNNPNCDYGIFAVPDLWATDMVKLRVLGEKNITRSTQGFDGVSDSGCVLPYDRTNTQMAISVPKGTTLAQAKAMFDGAKLIYTVESPTTEQAAPFTSPQWVDGSGTEQYVSTSLVPIGHYTQYPEDLKSKIEGLPWDFASLIAPTEATYKATRAYSTGNLFIVNNILYKATTSIASGATITPNTNCTQTTLAAVIAAL